ncbi:DUF4386 domain-containing protein [Geojedonia litorea]|uniref:DUF4386 domain-containing protein n=1 Tax=Geojedonia litorea TaxID=1268269 RepID=A0ABV9N2P7_9FLAO
MNTRTLAKIIGLSYLSIFFTAIFANFFVLEALLNDPLASLQDNHLMVRWGILAFMVTVALDVIIAWALYELFKEHVLSRLSTYFRLMHAAIMGVALFALQQVLVSTTAEAIIKQVDTFNTIWLLGLFFFGIHLMLLAKIIGKPKVIALFLVIAGLMYMLDTVAHLMLTNYDAYSSLFLALVAIPSIIGELSLAIWLLVKGGKGN